MVALSLSNFSVHYGKTVIQHDLTLPAFPAGSLVGLLGPNGVGKSTVLRALAGLGEYHGSASLDGVELSDLSHRQRTASIGYLPQTLPQGSSLVAYEAVLSACRAVRGDLPKATIESLVERIFTTLNIRHLAFSPLSRLSGGQRQMVGLAQVLVREPPVLLLDEPTSALDLRWQLTVLEVTRAHIQRAQGVCFAALHDLNFALRHCDYLVVLGPKGLLAAGPAAEALTSDILRAAYRVEGRLTSCLSGEAVVLIDRPLSPSS